MFTSTAYTTTLLSDLIDLAAAAATLRRAEAARANLFKWDRRRCLTCVSRARAYRGKRVETCPKHALKIHCTILSTT